MAVAILNHCKWVVRVAVWLAGTVEAKDMDKEGSILFGVDEAVFARQAIAATGSLLKDDQNLKITISSIATATTKDTTEVNYPVPQSQVKEWGRVPG